MFPPAYFVGCSFEAKSHYIDEAGLELEVLLCQPPKFKDDKLASHAQGTR